MDKQKQKPLYKPFKYKGKGKFKYSVYVKNKTGNTKIIHFGHSDYQDFTQHKRETKKIIFSKGERNKRQARKFDLEK
mgnify:CR=1 FL=1